MTILEEQVLGLILREQRRIFEVVQDIQRRLMTMSGTTDTLANEITQLTNTVSQNTSAIDSATQVIATLQAKLAQAIQDASNNGATADQLAALNTLNSTLQQKTQDLAQSIVTSTPADTGGGAQPAQTAQQPVQPTP